ncbi:MAG: type II toxin-antitoxin system VapC family toxin [Polyangiaceae bacterium]|nr:type II toxin-antitoxin system VapC family toxin [Polyangiaceae bacterium]
MTDIKEYVLDTHAFVWWVTKPARLGRDAARALRQVDAGKARAWIPAIVGVELTLLAEAGRRVPGAVELEAATKRNSEVRILSLDLRQTSEFALLGALEDPFDRMIVAAARAARMPLITADTRITESGLVDVVWG